MRLTILGQEISNEQVFYKRIVDFIGYQNHFGNNLDALYDMLTESRPHYEIEIIDPDFPDRFGGRGAAILAVMEAAAEANKAFDFFYNPEETVK